MEENNIKKQREQEEYFDEKKEILSQKIEAILFYRGVETTYEYIKKQTEEKKDNIDEALKILEKRLEKSALVLIKNENKYLLTVNSKNSDIIKKIKGHEEYGELSKSALETLSIILYKSPISRFDIDNIRGVNSSYSLRNLSIRGLIEKVQDSSGVAYIPTVNTFSYLGITSKDELPQIKEITKKLDQIEKEVEEQEKTVFE